MSARFEPLTAQFGVRVHGINLNSDLDAGQFQVLRDALDDHSVLVFSGQPMTDAAQIEFGRWWGELEPTRGANPASGTVFARQSNLDIQTGVIIPGEDRRMHYQKGNYQWHADSTFKPVPSLCSILSAREVPPSGGNTEFVSTRAAYECLAPERQATVDALTVIHDFSVSRGRVGFRFTPEEAALYPPVRHPLVQPNPRTGRKSLLIGAHAARIDGWDDARGAALLEELLEHATTCAPVYSHAWQAGDLIVWDNRSVLHRATAYDAARHRRLMQRLTISNPAVLDTEAYRRLQQ